MDRGSVDFDRLFTLHQAGAFFVTRAKRGIDARRVYSMACDRSAGIVCDQRIMLSGYYSAKHYPEHLRRIRYRDPETGKTLVFLTNNTALPALSVAALFRNRWQVEISFKWIKLRCSTRLANQRTWPAFDGPPAAAPDPCPTRAFAATAIRNLRRRCIGQIDELVRGYTVDVSERHPDAKLLSTIRGDRRTLSQTEHEICLRTISTAKLRELRRHVDVHAIGVRRIEVTLFSGSMMPPSRTGNGTPPSQPGSGPTRA